MAGTPYPIALDLRLVHREWVRRAAHALTDDMRLAADLEQLRASFDVETGGPQGAWCVALLPLSGAFASARVRQAWGGPRSSAGNS